MLDDLLVTTSFMTSHHIPAIERLPDEVRRRIGLFCDDYDSPNLALVSKAWQDAGEAQLWYMASLAVSNETASVHSYLYAALDDNEDTLNGRLSIYSPVARQCVRFSEAGPLCYIRAVECLNALRSRPARASYVRMLEVNGCSAALEVYKDIIELVKHRVENLDIGDHLDKDALINGMSQDNDKEMAEWDLMDLHRIVTDHEWPRVEHLELTWGKGPEGATLLRYLHVCPRLRSINIWTGPSLLHDRIIRPDPGPTPPEDASFTPIYAFAYSGAIQFLVDVPAALWQSARLSELRFSIEPGWEPADVAKITDTGNLSEVRMLAIDRIQPQRHGSPSSCLLQRLIDNGMRNVDHLALEESWINKPIWDLPELRVLTVWDTQGPDYDIGIGNAVAAEYTAPLRGWLVDLLDHYPKLIFLHLVQSSVAQRQLDGDARRVFFTIIQFVDAARTTSLYHVRYAMETSPNWRPAEIDPQTIERFDVVAKNEWKEATYYRGRSLSLSTLATLYEMAEEEVEDHLGCGDYKHLIGFRQELLPDKVWKHLEELYPKMPLAPDPLPPGQDEFFQNEPRG